MEMSDLHPIRALNDESGQILRQIILIGLIVLVVGFLIVEVGPIIVGRISIINDAETVANAVAFVYKTAESESAAVEEAARKMRLMGYSDDEIRESVVEFLPVKSKTKEKVRVTVVRYANTLVTRHIKYFKRFARMAKTSEVSISGSTSGESD
jgi:hypothetical protein